jgi:hypothetical protein
MHKIKICAKKYTYDDSRSILEELSSLLSKKPYNSLLSKGYCFELYYPKICEHKSLPFKIIISDKPESGCDQIVKGTLKEYLLNKLEYPQIHRETKNGLFENLSTAYSLSKDKIFYFHNRYPFSLHDFYAIGDNFKPNLIIDETTYKHDNRLREVYKAMTSKDEYYYQLVEYDRNNSAFSSLRDLTHARWLHCEDFTIFFDNSINDTHYYLFSYPAPQKIHAQIALFIQLIDKTKKAAG